MGVNLQPRIVVVTRETRMQGLLKRWATKQQAQFVFRKNRAVAAANVGDMELAMAAQQQDDEDFLELNEEDEVYREATQELVARLDFGWPVQVIDRRYLPTIDFELSAVVVVVGQDGLVANTAKYVGDTPIVAVNPDPRRIDGVLLPYSLANARAAVGRVIHQQHLLTPITLAEAELHDGQRLLAFNDLFIGAKSHVSARYELHVGSRAEEQSSSGILVATGAGSTGWMSSVFNMVQGVSRAISEAPMAVSRPQLAWTDRRLRWAVREPFQSRTTGVSLVTGEIDQGDELVIESRMPHGGVIFSDGVESDFLDFDGGTIARIRVASQSANLVVPHSNWKR